MSYKGRINRDDPTAKAIPTDRPFTVAEFAGKVDGRTLRKLEMKGIVKKIGKRGDQGRRHLWQVTDLGRARLGR